jgi:hypothetical protein
MWRKAALVIWVVVGVRASAFDRNLAEKYSATLEPSAEPVGLDWTCTVGDVWALKSFSCAGGDQLKIELGPSTVVFGTHDKNVVWAALFPDEPAPLKSPQAGDGERVASIWMRFHPARIAELFPPPTVQSIGRGSMRMAGERLCHWKMIGSWQAGNLPMIPTRNSLVLDIDTTDGKRRFFTLESDTGKVQYVDAFVQRALPQARPVESASAAAAFNKVWEAFDAEYPMFAVKPKLDWSKLRDRYLAKAREATTNYELAARIGELVGNLEDLHVWVRVGPEYVPVYKRSRPLNASWKAIESTIPGFTDTRRNLAWGRTGDGIGYVNVYALGSQELPGAFDAALDQLADTWGLILDLRFNGGGDELLGGQLAGRFLDQPRIYSVNQYRNGPKHDDLGPKLERSCEPRGPWRYESPVVVLFGQKTMSSAESFALMLAQCPQVTTMGDRTAGSSANPRQIEAGEDIVVNLPRWLDMDPSGKPLDPDGVAPKVRIDAKPADFTPTCDPALNAALEHLRKQPTSDRRPGKRQ